MLETLNLAHKHLLYVVSKNIPFCTKVVLILLMSAFFAKSVFFGCVRDFLVLFSVFVRQKVTVNEIITGIWLPNCSKLSVNWKNGSSVIISEIPPTEFCPISRDWNTKFGIPSPPRLGLTWQILALSIHTLKSLLYVKKPLRVMR